MKVMSRKYKYIGCFFEIDDIMKIMEPLKEERLSKVIRYPHVTFAYMPETVDEALFGTDMRVMAVGYGRDEENEGLEVELSSDIPELMDMIRAIPVPHITVSVSERGEAVNTQWLRFESIPPVILTGKFGGYLLEEEEAVWERSG
ncbi:MAG: hypothetical protein LUE14_07055 [Clostridiales bacterium]|nr:hypothetical protein [Clostridiales bacterium]